MRLQERLDAHRARFEAKADPAVLQVLHEATESLARSGILEHVARVGGRAPDFELPGPGGRIVRLTDGLARAPVVLSFYRGHWWPYCNLELEALKQALPEIEAAGASLIAVSPERPEYLAAMAEKHRLTFDLLSDEGNRVAGRYGLVFPVDEPLRGLYQKFGFDLPTFNGDDSWTLPIPARFVIDRTGVIRWGQADPDYTKRPEPSDTVEALRVLAK